MSKVKYGRWKKIIDAQKPEMATISIPIKDGSVEIQVRKRLPFSEQIALVQDAVRISSPVPDMDSFNEGTPWEKIEAYRRPALEYFDGVFKMTVLDYYTNLDLHSDDRIQVDAIHALTQSGSVYEAAAAVIEDPLPQLYEAARETLVSRMSPRDQLAGRILYYLNRLESENLTKIVAQMADIVELAGQLSLDEGGNVTPISEIIGAQADES